MVNGCKIGCKGSSDEEIEVQGTALKLWSIVIDQVVDGIDVVIG